MTSRAPAPTPRRSFGGRVFCHAPADQPFAVEVLARDAGPDDRWSVPGTRSAYLASTAAVAAAEWARHAGDGAADRTIVALELRPIRVLDFRRGPSTCPGDAAGTLAFLDREHARRTAADARRSGVSGILVPSIAFPDRPDDAFNLVVFCDALPDGIATVLAGPRTVGRIRVDPGS